MTVTLDRPLVLPPLMWAEETGEDALDHARMRATLGCDAGLLTYRRDPALLDAALVFAPEVTLSKAMTMLPLCGVGFQNALGALAPPEVAVHLEWTGGIRINGARCGGLRAAAADPDPDAIPDWLAIGLTMPLMQPAETGPDGAGLTPDSTALYSEGCADVAPNALLEAWSRHTLSWITRWEQGDLPALHAEWRGLAHGIGEPITIGSQAGTFLGVDEDFSLLLRDHETTRAIALTTLLEPAP